MDQQLFELARQLQTKLERIDPEMERDTFEWAHDFLIRFIDRIETSVPALKVKRLQMSARADMNEASRILKKLTLDMGLPDDLDSLEQIERELGADPDEGVGVPAKQKPRPKGSSGGAALPLPNSDFKI